MNNKQLIDFLNLKVDQGTLKKIKERHSFNIAVKDGNRDLNCTIITDLYTDLNGNHLYRIEQHIDLDRDYHSVDVTEFTQGFF
jgi:hypothetical protein